MKKILLGILVLLLAFIAVLFGRAFLASSQQSEYALIDLPPLDQQSIENFQEAIQIPTLSHGYTIPTDTASFYQFHDTLASNYPLVDSFLTRETIADLSLLYTWEGTHAAAKPIVLIGHMDVVPIATPEQWEEDPFSGVVRDGYIWGRGTLDDKISVVSVLEATERLLAQGFQPGRTIYFAFGHDEEIGGYGAQALAKALKQRGVEAEFVLDEGGVVTDGLVPGIDDYVAVVSIAEKGYMTVRMEVLLEEGGHSSMPPKETSTEILSRAVVSIRDNQPSTMMAEPTKMMFEYLGAEMAFPYNLVFVNQDILAPIVPGILAGTSPSGNATVRTTTSPTVLKAGIKDNILPTKATALVNFRLLPGNSSEEILAHLREVVDDERVTIEPIPGTVVYEASVVSSTESFGFSTIDRAIKEVFDSTLVAPNLSVGYTDVRQYQGVSSDLYRFLPFHATSEDLARIHGTNERLSLKDYQRGIAFYEQVIRHGSQAQ
ncbi:MAG: M20 family peptidase [Bacteroidota bacterium]